MSSTSGWMWLNRHGLGEEGTIAMTNPKGFPRPVLPKDGKNTPVPWLGADGPSEGKWAFIDHNRAEQSEVKKLCIICGKKLKSDNMLYMLTEGQFWSNRVGMFIFDELPTPTWAHPKCAQIAALYCPHLKEQEYPAMLQTGQKLTHAELRELAHNSPKP